MSWRNWRHSFYPNTLTRSKCTVWHSSAKQHSKCTLMYPSVISSQQCTLVRTSTLPWWKCTLIQPVHSHASQCTHFSALGSWQCTGIDESTLSSPQCTEIMGMHWDEWVDHGSAIGCCPNILKEKNTVTHVNCHMNSVVRKFLCPVFWICMGILTEST